MGEVKMTVNFLKEIMEGHIIKAEKMTPRQLNKAIKDMQKLSRILRPNGAENVRLMVFQEILEKKGGYGPRRPIVGGGGPRRTRVRVASN